MAGAATSILGYGDQGDMIERRKDAAEAAAEARKGDSRYDADGNRMTGRQRASDKQYIIFMEVLLNICDYLCNMLAVWLFFQTRYNNEIDSTDGLSGLWSRAGCYNGGAELSPGDAPHKARPSDLAGDHNLVYAVCVLLTLKFFAYRVFGNSMVQRELSI